MDKSTLTTITFPIKIYKNNITRTTAHNVTPQFGQDRCGTIKLLLHSAVAGRGFGKRKSGIWNASPQQGCIWYKGSKDNFFTCCWKGYIGLVGTIIGAHGVEANVEALQGGGIFHLTEFGWAMTRFLHFGRGRLVSCTGAVTDTDTTISQRIQYTLQVNIQI